MWCVRVANGACEPTFNSRAAVIEWQVTTQVSDSLFHPAKGAVSMAEYKLSINGELVESSSGKRVDVIGPASGEPIAQVPESSLADVERAVAAAREAFDDGRWSGLTHGARAAALEKLATLAEAHAAELA